MARIPWLIGTVFFSSYEIQPIDQESKYLGIFHHKIVCCACSLELPHRGYSNEYTQHTITVYLDPIYTGLVTMVQVLYLLEICCRG